jgi:predicted nucleic acid-binding protein
VIYILDACALIAFLNRETGQEIVADLLKKAQMGEAAIYMNIVNLIEVYYGYIRDVGRDNAAIILERIYAAPITIRETISKPVFHEASRLKSAYKCSLADAVGLATAVTMGGTFVTSDHHELEAVEQNEHIPILWLPPRPHK